jgi:hypothetical protein
MYKQVVKPEAGFLIAHITYTNAHNNVLEVKRSYRSMEDADRFIEAHMRSWMAEKLTRYIHHKVMLYEYGIKSWYGSINRLLALDHCRSIIPVLSDCSLYFISNWILANEKQLTSILPSQKNKSYDSSYRNLQELVWMSVRIRKVRRENSVTA